MLTLSSPDNPQVDPQPEPRLVMTSADASTSTLFSDALPVTPPPRDPVWSGWDVLMIAGLTLASIFIVSLGLGLAAHVLFPKLSLNSAAAEIAVAAQFISYVMVATFMVMLLQGKYGVPFTKAIRWNWPTIWVKYLGLGVLLLLSITLVSRFLPMPKSTPFEQMFDRRRDAYLIAVFAVTLGPLMEELFFRGLLYPVLARRLGVFWGVVLTALPFGLMHMFQYGYAWGVVLLIFLMGVVCTVVRAVTGSVASSFLVHVGYNGTEMLLLMLATDGFRHMEKAVAVIQP